MTMQTQDSIEQEVTTGTPAEETATEQTSEATESTAQEQQTQTDTEGEAPARKPNGVQKRIDELTRKSHEAEREAAYWRQRANGGPDGAKASAEQAAPSKPTPDKFTEYADYVEALTDWKVQEGVRAAMSALNADRAKEAQQKVRQTREETWVERQSVVRQALPDYDEVLASTDVQVSEHVQEVLLESEHGPALAYHLAKNPDEAERISALSPLAAARALGRIEASLSSPTQAPAPAAVAPKTVTKAPAPITPLRGTGGQFTKAPEAMTDAEWFASQRKKS